MAINAIKLLVCRLAFSGNSLIAGLVTGIRGLPWTYSSKYLYPSVEFKEI